MVLISEKVSAITHNTNSNLTTTSSGSDRPPLSDGVRYGQMDRQEDNRQFCAFNGKQEKQLGGDVTDHDHDSLSDQIPSEAFSQDYLLEHNKPNVKFNFIPVNESYIDNIINILKINQAVAMNLFLISILITLEMF